MGCIISKLQLDSNFFNINNKLLVICSDLEKIKSEFSGYFEVNLGYQLSSILLRFHKKLRNKMVIEELNNIILYNNAEQLIVNNIEILFNPSYKINIINYFINIAKIKKIVLIWPGKIIDTNLQYSEIGYVDYKKYKIDSYDIICVN